MPRKEPSGFGPHEVIMPALGMAQDTGLIVAWHKAAGDAVAAEDILFEVETDKATMEVEAGADGYVAELLAEAGEEAPVGETIAVITADKPDTPVQQSRAAPRKTKAMTAARPEEPPAAKEKPAPPGPTPVRSDGRILASPKARRLALEQGLDLARLVEAGHPQPYHAADLDRLKALPATPPAPQQTARRHLTAEIPQEGFTAFALWARDAAGIGDDSALLAGLAAAGLGKDSSLVAVDRFGATRLHLVPAGPLSGITEADTDAPPDLRLRDLRLSRITTVDVGPEDTPVLTLTQSGTGLAVTLDCAAHHLTGAEAISLISEFAGRMEQPLRHLL